MKKQFTTLFLLAATMLVPPALTGCGEEIEDLEGGPRVTTFSSAAPDGTRTWMDANAYFYWSDASDNIWLEVTPGSPVSLTPKTVTDNLATYEYTSTGYLTGSYNVYYTGKNSTRHDRVTIASQQHWSSSRIAEFGDCGVATATRVSEGKYSFELEHKAAYLIIKPYGVSSMANQWKVTGIRIMSTTDIAGTYSFSTSGLSASPISGGSRIISLLSDGSSFALYTTPSDPYYVVIAPGTRSLVISFTIKKSDGTTSTQTKTISSRNFYAGSVWPIEHQLTEPTPPTPTTSDFSGNHLRGTLDGEESGAKSANLDNSFTNVWED